MEDASKKNYVMAAGTGDKGEKFNDLIESLNKFADILLSKKIFLEPKLFFFSLNRKKLTFLN